MGLREKEKLFCRFYCQTRNLKEAAVSAGYILRPEQAAARLLRRGDILEELARLCEVKNNPKSEIEAGYRRAAFGSAADAVKLMLSGEPFSPEEIDRMDFFNISEIKYQKEKGHMEIKFFDRIKALEKLEEFSRLSREEGGSSFYRALEESAKKISENERDD